MDHKDKNKLKRGLLIVFEGIDGTGKSTQLELLSDHLQKHGYRVVKTKEPTDGIHGQKIRQLYLNRDGVSRQEELDLFLRDRKEHVEKLINPSIAEKSIVLCDRYYLSTVAYQGAAGLDVNDILEKNSFAPKPDIALLFQLNPQSSIERITQNRGDSLNEFEQESALIQVEKIFNSLKYSYIRHINADQPIEAVHQDVLAVIDEQLQSATY